MTDAIETYCRAKGLPEPVREYAFAEGIGRKWRLDYCWPAQGIALEIEGAVWMNGRHTRGSGFVKDIEKYNELACMGCRLLRATPQQVESGAVYDWLDRTIGAKT
jgi:hypothetical protein